MPAKVNCEKIEGGYMLVFEDDKTKFSFSIDWRDIDLGLDLLENIRANRPYGRLKKEYFDMPIVTYKDNKLIIETENEYNDPWDYKLNLKTYIDCSNIEGVEGALYTIVTGEFSKDIL